jgi:hypothetical protein
LFSASAFADNRWRRAKYISRIFYGADPEKFAFVLPIFPELNGQAAACQAEFKAKNEKWQKLLAAHTRPAQP